MQFDNTRAGFCGVIRTLFLSECGVLTAFCDRLVGKIRVKTEPVPVYAMEMDQHERDSDMGEDSPVVSHLLLLLVIYSYDILHLLRHLRLLSILQVDEKYHTPIRK